ncbi:ubiquitin-conjugating enzyme E2 2 isoform X2 [Ziziphus jujuba]|uniref:Ubiquitin-conjugating enzyme E2 2 isoform X2 n=1 Tax=Ziziphus jujuba TaxID=326968 RepID=A0A6P4A7W3_ZIZJJ|nr:ubiquitin-conjugating enzyme E2 2 isoform X2 [Ziziphus jujuba]
MAVIKRPQQTSWYPIAYTSSNQNQITKNFFLCIANLQSFMASSSSAQLRLMSDLKSIINEPPEGCSASPLSEDNLFVWSATIFGPDETPWEGGVFSLRLTFGDNYPEKPPRVRFTSEIFHPNVYHDGTLCMDIIQDAWSPCHNVSTILTSVQQFVAVSTN